MTGSHATFDRIRFTWRTATLMCFTWNFAAVFVPALCPSSLHKNPKISGNARGRSMRMKFACVKLEIGFSEKRQHLFKPSWWKTLHGRQFHSHWKYVPVPGVNNIWKLSTPLYSAIFAVFRLLKSPNEKLARGCSSLSYMIFHVV